MLKKGRQGQVSVSPNSRTILRPLNPDGDMLLPKKLKNLLVFFTYLFVTLRSSNRQVIMKYPIGIQNFESIRRDGYAYVDKTAWMWKMIDEGKYYFLSRPRRFGKSLMVSTLEAFFSGQRELFKGLYVDTVEWDWQQYPIKVTMYLSLRQGAASIAVLLLFIYFSGHGSNSNSNSIH